MANLRDQLLKAGLVSEKEAKQATHQKKVHSKQAGHKEAAQAERQADEQQARRAQAERKAQDQQLNRSATEREQEKASGSQQRQRTRDAVQKALREGVLPSWEGRREYFFADGTTVRSLHVTDEAARRLEAGKAAIVRLPERKNGFTVLLAGAATALEEADPAAIAVFHR